MPWISQTIVGGLHKKLWALKSREFQLWEFRDKMIFGCWSCDQAQSIL
jgi:hypothetical protein